MRLLNINSAVSLCFLAFFFVACSSTGRVGVEVSDSIRTAPETYILDVTIEPETNRITGKATVNFAATDELIVYLANECTITSLRARGAKVKSKQPIDSEHAGVSQWILRLSPTASRLDLLIEWEGELYQDHRAGEIAGEIHNKGVRRTISPEGVYLTGAWFPMIESEELFEYQLTLNDPEDMELVAAGILDVEGDGYNTWVSPYPMTGIALVGGNHEIHRDIKRGVEISLHLKESQAQHAEGLFDAIELFLERYEPLLGPLPSRQYRVVDNFFSSGFAFPGFTLLSSVVIDMGERAQVTHGYIDHEFVHSWFGNSIKVDYEDGNWCEALTSYLTNYYGFVLDGNEDGARTYRRNAMHSFSRLPESADKPLRTFGTAGGAGRTIGYNKGAVIFHMLAEEVGQERFFEALRRITSQYSGDILKWKDVQTQFEIVSGQNLDWFFQQWVDSSGAIDLSASGASWDQQSQLLEVTLENPSGFRGTVKALARLDNSVTVPINGMVEKKENKIVFTDILRPISSLRLNPDYDLFQKIETSDLIPTTNATRRGERLVVIVEEEEKENLKPYYGLFERRYDAEKIEIVTETSEVLEGWEDAGIVIVGQAAKSRTAELLLSDTESNVVFTDRGFLIEDQGFMQKNQSLLATFRHPNRAGCGVTVITANSPDAYPRAMNLPFYPNSIVVFEEARPVFRKDLERYNDAPVIAK